MAKYGETDYERGVLYGLEHDVPAHQDAVNGAVRTALKDINKGPSHFTEGHRYPLNQIQDAMEQAIATRLAEIRQRD